MSRWMNQSISDKAVYRTAAATPGLLKIQKKLVLFFSDFSHGITHVRVHVYEYVYMYDCTTVWLNNTVRVRPQATWMFPPSPTRPPSEQHPWQPVGKSKIWNKLDGVVPLITDPSRCNSNNGKISTIPENHCKLLKGCIFVISFYFQNTGCPLSIKYIQRKPDDTGFFLSNFEKIWRKNYPFY